MDAIDRELIHATQAGLPLVAEPYRAIGERIGITDAEVRRRFERLLAEGVVRRIGVVPNHYRLGYRANGMSVWDVDDACVDEAGREVGRLDFVSHCYRRPRHLPEWPYNLFAMVHGRDRAEVEAKVVRVAEVLGSRYRARDVLYSTRILKKTGLRLAAATGSGE